MLGQILCHLILHTFRVCHFKRQVHRKSIDWEGKRALMLLPGKHCGSKNSLSGIPFRTYLKISSSTPLKLGWRVTVDTLRSVFGYSTVQRDCGQRPVSSHLVPSGSLKLEPAQPEQRTVLQLELGAFLIFSCLPDFRKY